MGSVYINGYDHPEAIAGSGSIGVEILDQLPETDVIMVPVGGGGLLSGITEYVKHVKPETLIYGVEPIKGCSFFKAMQNNKPYATVGTLPCIADKLLIPMIGVNAFYTAHSNISKMVLVDDDWINRAILELGETENIVVEGAGATSLAALLAVPTVLPELQGKTVVCVITSGNMDSITFPRCLQRGKAIEGRLIQFKVKLPSQSSREQSQIFTAIASTGCNLVECYYGPAWITSNSINYIWLHLKVGAFDLEQSCNLKIVMTKLFPDMCEFMEEPFSPIPTCACFPRKRFQNPN
ncbi:uncharacterized protein LOC113226313 [Hyposmocoma kahamanoa]|uniref:uncharacterized protein LOC113226313 n=1 Tax=Hyposmocoma kahamanoa TaxID=1477025 RepID=UPI000E6D5B92|nr:uncharacterized protein LOC113226313 [Hyposmocoma kahamanoa]